MALHRGMQSNTCTTTTARRGPPRPARACSALCSSSTNPLTCHEPSLAVSWTCRGRVVDVPPLCSSSTSRSPATEPPAAPPPRDRCGSQASPGGAPIPRALRQEPGAAAPPEASVVSAHSTQAGARPSQAQKPPPRQSRSSRPWAASEPRKARARQGSQHRARACVSTGRLCRLP